MLIFANNVSVENYGGCISGAVSLGWKKSVVSFIQTTSLDLQNPSLDSYPTVASALVSLFTSLFIMLSPSQTELGGGSVTRVIFFSGFLRCVQSLVDANFCK